MVKKNYIGLLLLPILLLSSCKDKVLRSDIKEFIASFSLSESMDAYKEAGYEYVQIVTEKDITKEVEKVDFNVKDLEHVSYQYTYQKLVNDIEVSNEFKSITTVEGEYIYSDNETEPVEITINDVNAIVTTFFYKAKEADYHGQSMYYGDIVCDMAYDFQKYITIDNENKILNVDYTFYYTKIDTTFTQKIAVNQMGMLVNNELEITSPSGVATSYISVYQI